VFAHIAGIPVEETALGFAPVFLTVGGLVGYRLRRLISAKGAAVRSRR
jgi:hypothetical protein